MCYELYIDVLFLVNLFFDFLLLLTVRNIMKYPVSWGHVFLGGITGAAFTCLVIASSLDGLVKLILCHVIVNMIMIKVGLKIKHVGELIKAVIVLYVVSILYGGILELFHPYLHTEIIYFIIAILCAVFIRNMWKIFLKEKRTQNTKCAVVLQEGKTQIKVTALIDTGNTLTDPISGEPVSIIEKELAKKMWKDKEQDKGIRYIPFCTIESKGMMPIFRIEKMQVVGKEEILIQHPIVGVCEGVISEVEEYQIILNPDILGGL